MKKNSLFKSLMIILGAIVLICAVLAVCGYFVPSLEGMFSMVPLLDIPITYVQALYYFFDTVFFLLILGAFYGVLNEVPAYKKLVDKISQKLKKHSKLFVFITIGLFAVLTSVTGLMGALLVFVPFFVAVILSLGYDKLVALSSTIAAMFVGFIGGIYVTFMDPNNSYYGYAATTFEEFVGAGKCDNLIPKLVLLVLGVTLLIFFVNRYINNVQKKKVKYELNESNEVTVSEVKGDYKNIRTWPIIVLFGLLFVLFVLGYLPWNTLFGLNIFDNFNTWLVEKVVIGEFAVFPNIISSSISGGSLAFGYWASLGSYVCMIAVLIIATLLVKVIYRVKFDEAIANFVSGAKKMVPTVLLLCLAYTILVISYNHGLVANVITWFTDSLGINVGTTALVSALATLLHSDLYYVIAGGLLPAMNSVTDESLFATYAMTFQSVYGIVSLIAPTGLFVIFGLKYFDVPYSTWCKYIWRFVLMLLLLVLLVVLVMSLI